MGGTTGIILHDPWVVLSGLWAFQLTDGLPEE
jgi:hypothetical protein